MGLTLPQTCNMGSSQTGLVGIIGVTLLNPDGTVKTARTTAGIYEIGGGAYGKNIGFDDHWIGLIVWDTGGANPYYAVTEYNLEGMSDIIIDDTAFLKKTIKNKRVLTKTGSSWYLIIYDDDGVTELINKKLTDKNDADIIDIATGILAQEATSSV